MSVSTFRLALPLTVPMRTHRVCQISPIEVELIENARLCALSLHTTRSLGVAVMVRTVNKCGAIEKPSRTSKSTQQTSTWEWNSIKVSPLCYATVDCLGIDRVKSTSITFHKQQQKRTKHRTSSVEDPNYKNHSRSFGPYRFLFPLRHFQAA